ncbi:MAG TPA: B12-binding domain-containing protein, partial [Anaerolineales bacterium]|nr:B12-binding domain-containing protein [Anaerolineales bacterium]
MEDLLKMLADAVLAGEKPVAERIVRQAIEAGIQPEKILKEGLTRAMDEVGRRFECGEAFIPEMLIAAKSMQAALAILKPYLVDTGVQPSGKVVIGTVKGDLHDIGKNLVGMMLEGAGFQIVDLGTDVSPEKFIE